MRIYIVQENFDYMDEDSTGEDEYSVNRDVVGVCTSMDGVVRTVAEAVVDAAFHEYYTVGTGDYRVLQADVEEGGTCRSIGRVWLTGEQKKEAERIIRKMKGD